jgi:hypothetical protein
MDMKYFFIFFLVLINSCCYAQYNQPEIIQLTISKQYEYELKLSDIAQHVTYIPLETTEDCLIGEIQTQMFAIIFSKDFIFVNNNGIVMQFTPTGKFIRRINTVGQGPGEGVARKFAIDEEKRIIYIYNNFGFNILVYRFDGKYLRSIRNPFANLKGDHTVNDMVCYNENLLFTFDFFDGQTPYKYIVTDNKGKILHKEINYNKYFLKERMKEFTMFHSPLIETDSSLFYKAEFNDTIFKINQDYTRSPVSVCRLPNQITVEEYMKTAALIRSYTTLYGKNRISAVRNSNEYLDIYHAYNPYEKNKTKSFFSRYNKCAQQLQVNINTTIVNDWDGGMDVEMIAAFQRGNILCHRFWPHELKEKLTSTYFAETSAKYPEQKNALKKMINNLKEDDNPVLMLIHLK